MGFWNVRTMNQLSKTEQVLKEMRQYLIDILVLSEIRWTGNGLEKFSDGYVMAFIGHPSVHRAGVGLLMSPLAHKAMTNWNPVNERIMTARFVSNHTKMTIIACYAPTSEADEEEKDAFYNMLHSVTKDVPRHNVLCVVGDLNAKVGADRQYCPEVLGPHGMGEINENGTLLIDYALSNDLIIGGSMFDHKTIHKFEALNLLDETNDFDVENTWTSVKSVYHDVPKANLGFKKRKKEEWISDDTWKYISKRKETRTLILNTSSPEQKAQLQLRYKEEDKAVKRSARKDKRIVIERKAAFAEEAAKKGDSKMKADERWASHFEKVLNRPRPDDPETVPDTPFLQIDVSADPPSTVEVTTAVKKLKNGRAPGVDGITAEMLKASLRACMFVWTALLVAIWNNEKVPKDWTRGILVKLFKKGDAQICDNWRGINLTSVPSKILASVILQRLRAALDSHLREEQHGFRPGRSCSDLIFILRLIVEESREWNKKLYLLFIDLKRRSILLTETLYGRF
ncbi:craniofacial development protein 2-like [Artemia franciscana]